MSQIERWFMFICELEQLVTGFYDPSEGWWKQFAKFHESLCSSWERGPGKKLSIVSMRTMSHTRGWVYSLTVSFWTVSEPIGLIFLKFLISCLKVWREDTRLISHANRRNTQMGLPGFGPESQAPKARRIPSYPTAPWPSDIICAIKRLTCRYGIFNPLSLPVSHHLSV